MTARKTPKKPAKKSSKKLSNVVSIAKARDKRDQALGEQMYANGKAFKLLVYEFDDLGVGYDFDGAMPEKPVVFITNFETGEGLAMSIADSKKLGEALAHCAKVADRERAKAKKADK